MEPQEAPSEPNKIILADSSAGALHAIPTNHVIPAHDTRSCSGSREVTAPLPFQHSVVSDLQAPHLVSKTSRIHAASFEIEAEGHHETTNSEETADAQEMLKTQEEVFDEKEDGEITDNDQASVFEGDGGDISREVNKTDDPCLHYEKIGQVIDTDLEQQVPPEGAQAPAEEQPTLFSTEMGLKKEDGALARQFEGRRRARKRPLDDEPTSPRTSKRLRLDVSDDSSATPRASALSASKIHKVAQIDLEGLKSPLTITSKRSKKILQIYTDGSRVKGSSGATHSGSSIAYEVRDGTYTGVAFAMGNVDNNSAELGAIFFALAIAKDKLLRDQGLLEIVSDSTLALQWIQCYWEAARQRAKIKKTMRAKFEEQLHGGPNTREVIRVIDDLVKRGVSINFYDVKSHTGDLGNETADRYAYYAASQCLRGAAPGKSYFEPRASEMIALSPNLDENDAATVSAVASTPIEKADEAADHESRREKVRKVLRLQIDAGKRRSFRVGWVEKGQGGGRSYQPDQKGLSHRQLRRKKKKKELRGRTAQNPRPAALSVPTPSLGLTSKLSTRSSDEAIEVAATQRAIPQDWPPFMGSDEGFTLQTSGFQPINLPTGTPESNGGPVSFGHTAWHGTEQRRPALYPTGATFTEIVSNPTYSATEEDQRGIATMTQALGLEASGQRANPHSQSKEKQEDDVRLSSLGLNAFPEDMGLY